jgi:dynein heavy chain
MISDELGRQFITPPTFDMRKTYEDSRFDQPIIIVLSAGADPMTELQKLADEEQQRVSPVSLGQGQAEVAKAKIRESQEIHQWVVLQNCHLSPSFMPVLDGLIEKMAELEPTSKFRLWLTSMPSERFPVTILQNGVKATIEPPRGLRNNMLRSYRQMDASEFETACEKPDGNYQGTTPAYKALMWGLCFFNALILERRKFGPLGWNIPYEFSNSDLAISQAQLVMFLNHYEKIPWDALRYMVAEANYGGRVTDINDRTLINVILEDFYCPAMLKKKH